MSCPLSVLVVDDEEPALDELAYLLRGDPRIGEVRTCDNATESLRLLQETEVDAVFLDIQMPGLTGIELAGVLARFRTPPALIFVTAHDEHALAAFDLRAVDYILKPVRAERIRETLTRLVGSTGDLAAAGQPAPDITDHRSPDATSPELQIPVELGGVTRFVKRSEITHVEAQGDYVRLHTEHGSHLIRTPLTQLEQEWRAAGFVRIHRSLLVSLFHVVEVRTDAGRCSVVVGSSGSGSDGQSSVVGVELGVSRRHTRDLKDLLAQRSAGRV